MYNSSLDSSSKSTWYSYTKAIGNITLRFVGSQVPNKKERKAIHNYWWLDTGLGCADATLVLATTAPAIRENP